MRLLLFSNLLPALILLISYSNSNALDESNNIVSRGFEVAQNETQSTKPVPTDEISLNQILDNHLKAIGGREAWQKIETLKVRGHMFTSKATFRVAALYKRPDLCRLDFQAGRMYFVEAYDGKTPWQMNHTTTTSAQILTGKRAKEMIDTCDFDGPLVDHKKKGHKIKFLGEQKVDERNAYVLKVNLTTGNLDTYYIDTETFLPFMIKGKTTIQENIVNTTIKIGEYIELSDIVVPFSFEFIVDGNPDTETLQIKTVEINSDLPNDLFDMPKRPEDLR